MNDSPLDELGPIDWIVIEWPGNLPNGEAMPKLIELVDKGIIHLLDLAVIAKDDDGNVAVLTIDDIGGEYAVFEGVSSGVLGDDDINEAGAALAPGTAAAVLVYENTWAAPFASTVRKSGGQLVASGRIPVQAMLAALEETDNATA